MDIKINPEAAFHILTDAPEQLASILNYHFGTPLHVGRSCDLREIAAVTPDAVAYVQKLAGVEEAAIIEDLVPTAPTSQPVVGAEAPAPVGTPGVDDGPNKEETE